MIVLFGILCTATLLLQIYLSAGSLSQTETTLFGILQFVFSTAFAFLLARESERKEFEKRQRSFAVAAYRRVREIRRGVDRIRDRAMRAAGSTKKSADAAVLAEMAESICETARSSAADWADVIGEEIQTIERVENLSARYQEESERRRSASVDDPISRGLPSREVDDLVEALPPQLRVEALAALREQSPYSKKIERMHDYALEYGYLVLHAFFEPDAGFDRQISREDEGADVTVVVDDARQRISALLVRDATGQCMGVVTNNRAWGESGHYSDFMTALTHFMGASRFDAKIVEVEEEPTGGRIYYKLHAWPPEDRLIEEEPDNATTGDA